jgi:hypothetical protein
MRFQPRLTDAGFDFDGHFQFNRVFHSLLNEREDFFLFGFVEIEHQFVVNLQQHARAEFSPRESGVDADHRDLDHVGSGIGA